MTALFNLRGPEFLAWYSVLAVLAVLFTLWVRRGMDGAEISLEAARPLVSDPYALAFLRGGERETLKVALLSLVDRGLIRLQDGGLATAADVKDEHARKPVERDLLAHFREPKDGSTLSSIRGVCAGYEEQLRQLRLIADDNLLLRRASLMFFMVAIVGGIGGLKILIGLKRDRPVGFLMILTFVAVAAVCLTASAHRTRHGDRFLRSMRTLFRRLERQPLSIRSGGATADLAFLAAVFGIRAVPIGVFPLRDLVFYPQYRKSSSSGSSGCGSSGCGGSSCGGGSCGGGCGGCGGD